MASQPPPAPPAVEARFADLCKELGLGEGVAGEAAALLDEVNGALLGSHSVGGRSAKDAERLCFAFVLYCAVKLKGRKDGSGVRLSEILKGCKLKWVMLCYDYLRHDDFFKEMQQLGLKIEKILERRYGRDWEGQLEAILLIHVPAKYRSFTIEGSSHLIKQTEKGVDIIASLCHNYHTSEERLKEMMGKSHKAIEDFFGMEAICALKCKTENLDKIDTGMEPSSLTYGLMCFQGLIDEESFQPNLEKMEKLCNSNSWEGELDLKLFLSNDYVPSTENSSGGSTNLGCSKRAFETLASPTKTIKNMLTVPCSPSSPANGGSVKVVQMTPVTSAMTTAKWLREVISSLPDKPSSKLQQLLSSCDRDLTNDVSKRVSIVLEAIFPTKSSADWGVSIGLNCANAFDIPWAEARKMEASKLYYRVLEAICRAESQNSSVNNLTPLLSNERFHRCLIACSAELVLATHKTVIMMFPAVLESTGLTAFDLSKIIENFVRHEETLPRELKRHLNSLEEQLLESMAWEKGSSLYNSLIVARPSLASEINRLGLLAEPMPSLDELVARQNIHFEGLPGTPSKKRAAAPDDNTDPRSPKRLCNESRNTVAERNLQTPPPKQSHIASTNLKAKCHPLQSTFASPTVSNPVGGNDKCADVTVQIFFSKVWIFLEILNNYKRERQCKPEVFLSIYVGNRNRNGVLGSRHVDIITFYNEVFVPAAKPFLVSLIATGTRPEDKKNHNSMFYAFFLSLNFYFFTYDNGRRINTRINFDMVSDSVVAGSLGQPNGGSTFLDPAAAFSPPSKKRKPDT
ncbi:Retinoblastoma-related protein 1 [Dichanthelium oligosanthes]|uniref:Retinoblastoma-related protein 1 n=1 Tax=Dichanthelium oligosanthes TaxID=888268 RepID=A0A1E5W1Z0_9POAL|nr:Retinoblastoma-related protein 1 [Dichanthelium oligosanthes]